MMTIDEIRAELAHLREVPARLRLERLMRESGGLVDMLGAVLEHACSIQEASPAIEPQPVVDDVDYAVGLSEVKPVKRKRGRPARRVENVGEA